MAHRPKDPRPPAQQALQLVHDALHILEAARGEEKRRVEAAIEHLSEAREALQKHVPPIDGQALIAPAPAQR